MKKFIQELENKHTLILNETERLSEALHNLRYEGKLFYKRNLRVVQEFSKFMKQELLPHMMIDDKVLFPFLQIHFPKLHPILSFLNGEHREIKQTFTLFNKLINTESIPSTSEQRNRYIEKLSHKGTYLVCLLRNHVQAESESIYRIMKHLKKEEQEVLWKQLKTLKSTHKS